MTLQDVPGKLTDALKGTPMLLVVLALNFAVLGMVTWLTIKAADVRQAERAELVRLLDQCMRRPG